MSDMVAAILWDDSHLWGLMAQHALHSLGIPHILVSGHDIAQGLLFRKPLRILLAPGGSARAKAFALGAAGRRALRQWVETGGFYLGFCGGAGLALTHGAAEEGLRLCPWGRRGVAVRHSNWLSGHVESDTPLGPGPLPVWWPGQFEELSGSGPKVLARYKGPGADLWWGGAPYAMGGRSGGDRRPGPESAALPWGQPLAIEGALGTGKYLLSYAHLETPLSPWANGWLAKIFASATLSTPSVSQIPVWNIFALDENGVKSLPPAWSQAVSRWHRTMAAAVGNGQLMYRSSWLLGWAKGVPGMECNHLCACIWGVSKIIQSGCTGEMATELGHLGQGLEDFCRRAEAWFERQQGDGTDEQLAPVKDSIFGHPMGGGGEIQQVLGAMDAFIYKYQMGLRLAPMGTNLVDFCIP